MATMYDQYRQTSIQTAPPEQLVVMLYDGAIRFLEQARVALERGEDASQPIGRTQDIIVELISSLNRSAGEIADTLFLLYDFMLHQLFKAIIRKDPKMLEEVSGMLRDLREAWATVASQKKSAAAVGAARPAAAINIRS